jgi:antitoxin component of MazEF toxin-antitoxin module
MKTTKKLINIGGNCSGVILDKPLLEKMNLKNGDLVEIEFKKIE